MPANSHTSRPDRTEATVRTPPTAEARYPDHSAAGRPSRGVARPTGTAPGGGRARPARPAHGDRPGGGTEPPGSARQATGARADQVGDDDRARLTRRHH